VGSKDITKKKCYTYWDNEISKGDMGGYWDNTSYELDTTLMSEDAQRHFGVATDLGQTDIEKEIEDWAFEYAYDYEQKNKRYAKGGGVDGFNALDLPVKYKLYDEKGNIIHTTTSFNRASDKSVMENLKVIATDKSGNSRVIREIKYAEGGSVDEGFDWNKIYEPLSEQEQEILNERIKKEEADITTKEKDSWAKNIKAVGKNWNDAFIRRVNSAKHNIDKFIEWSSKKYGEEKAQSYFSYALEDIDSIRELRYSALKYANNLEKRLREAYDKHFVKGVKKHAKGGQIEDCGCWHYEIGGL
jgi:hypothetical protein